MSAVLERVDRTAEVLPFGDNAEFLEAKLEEFASLIDCTAARREAGSRTEDARVQGRSGRAQADPAELELGGNGNGRRAGVSVRLQQAEQRWAARRARNDARLACSTGVALPFREMAARCGLDRFEQDVLWLLFFKTVSPDFRQQYEAGEFGQFGRELVPEIYIGNLLQILCPGSLTAQLAACRRFSVEAPLLAHHLVRQAREVQNSILEVELDLPHRVVAWISDDHRVYALDCPFVVEWPVERLEQVVLAPELELEVARLVGLCRRGGQPQGVPGLHHKSGGGRGLVVLEYGPPGTGKTLLARALANHTGRPLVLLNRQGSGCRLEPEEALPTLFREAQLQHGIVFIDECEEVCHPDSSWLRLLLIELERTAALVILATNRPEALAPALDRRCAIKLEFSRPDAAARQRIWEVHLAGARLASDVDVARLSRACPLTGGYIRNAVLTATNAAAVRRDGEVQLTHAGLEEAARNQMRQVAGGVRDRELVVPRLAVAQALLSSQERDTLLRLAGMAQHGLTRGVEDTAPWVALPHRGLKVLVHGGSYSTGVQAAEALAGELGVLMTRVPLTALLGSAAGSSELLTPEAAPAYERLLTGLDGADHVLVVTDKWGQLASLRQAARDDAMRGLFCALAGYAGVAVVVTMADRLALPRWARVFDEEVRLGLPDQAARREAWTRLSGGAVSGAQAEWLAAAHDLGLEEIQMAVHRARLRGAAGDAETELSEGLVSEAAAALGRRERASMVLFG